MSYRDIDFEDIPKALKAAGSTRLTLDRNDFATEIKRLQASSIGPNHITIDDHDMSEWVGRMGAFTGANLPALNLDLTNPNTALQLTTIRATNAWAENLAGVYSMFPPSIPRITDKGLLAEEVRINGIRNNSMQGAVPGTPGTLPTNWLANVTGLTVTVVGIGVENGVDYVDIRFAGTSGSTFLNVYMDTSTGIVAAPAQIWTQSTFAAVVGGSVANISTVFLGLHECDVAGTFLVQGQGLSFRTSLTATLARQTYVHTVANASAARLRPFLAMSYGNGAAIDITIRIGWPQLEQGAFPTSPIRTTSAAGQRNSDVIDHASFVPNDPACSLFAEVALVNPATGKFPGIVMAHGANGDIDRLGLYYVGSTLAGGASCMAASVTQFDAFGNPTSAGATSRSAAAYTTNDFAAARGGVIIGNDAVGTLPVRTKLALGRLGAGSNFGNCFIKRVSYWNKRLTNAQLQLLTGG